VSAHLPQQGCSQQQAAELTGNTHLDSCRACGLGEVISRAPQGQLPSLTLANHTGVDK
jgi:hypothetical protein